MSFKDAEAADSSVAGVSDNLRNSLRDDSYCRNPNQVYDNMDTDPLIQSTPAPGQPACRLLLLKRVAPHSAASADTRDEAKLFCREHLQEGPVFPDSDKTIFGRVCTFESLVAAIADSNSPASLDDARALLRDAIDAPSRTKLERQRFDLAGKNLSRYQMWSFPVTDPNAPLAEIGPVRAIALNLLGLGGVFPVEEVVAFAHRLPLGWNARIPTAWDAGFFPYWRAGGRAYRLDRDEYGLREVVHDRIRGEQLVASIVALR